MNEIFGMTYIETVSRLADIINEKELSEITVSDGDKVITVKGKKCPPPPMMPPMMPPMNAAAPAQNAQPAPAAAEAPRQETVSGNIIKSPIVGTFYSAPSPDKPAFVKIGDTVKKGDVIMIIESMKLMNEIQSEFDGVVDKILVTDGQAVEFDQPLMIIK